jgi:protease IV
MSSINDDPSRPEPAAPAAASQVQAGASVSEGVVEDFARAYLADRRADRRWRVAIRLAWLLLFAAIVYALFVNQRRASAPNGPHTALVEVRGEIGAESEASAENINGALRSAFEDSGAQAVVLRFNSPGGSPVQSGMVYDEIKRLKAKHKKPVYAICEEVCASGAYYMAVAADDIFVDKASIVGSIGVLMDGFGLTGAMEKFGIERRLITAGDNKAMLDPFSPLPERQRALAQGMLDQIHAQFIGVVKEGRGDRLKSNPDTFSGLFWNGEEAIKLGLADHLGNLDQVARDVVKAEEVIDYTPRENVAERLAKRFGASIGAGAVQAMRALPSIR